MNKIIISTNPTKAKSIVRESEIETLKPKIISLINETTLAKNWIQINNCEVYLINDALNCESLESLNGLDFDFNLDILIYHNITEINAKSFIDKFSKKKDSIHNSGNENLYRKIYLILVDDSIEDKYNAVLDVLYPPTENRSPSGNFNADLCNSTTTMEDLNKKYPEITQLACFLEYAAKMYPDGKNLFDTNNSEHLKLYRELKSSLNNSN